MKYEMEHRGDRDDETVGTRGTPSSQENSRKSSKPSLFKKIYQVKRQANIFIKRGSLKVYSFIHCSKGYISTQHETKNAARPGDESTSDIKQARTR